MVELVAKSKFIFVDESGDPDIDLSKSGTSDYFVLSAVIVDSDVLDIEQKKAIQIIDKYFPKGQIKSSKIGGNVNRRKKILDEVSNLEFTHYTQVIDKSLIYSDSGLRFRKSFIKFINRILYKNLFESFSDINIIADQYGRSDFMLGFQDYLLRLIPQRLFERSSFEFANSENYPFIQIADLVAGTINRCYSELDPMNVLNTINKNTIIIDEWPPRLPKPPGYENLPDIEKFNYLVRHRAVQQADSFIEKLSKTEDEYEQAQIAAVRYLLFHFRSSDPEEYIVTENLQKYLRNLGFDFSIRTIRQKVIASLRDQSVFIASNRFGIKLPYSVSDLKDFVNKVSSQVVPYLKRLEICRKYFILATEGELDIVNPEEYPALAKYLGDDS